MSDDRLSVDGTCAECGREISRLENGEWVHWDTTNAPTHRAVLSSELVTDADRETAAGIVNDWDLSSEGGLGLVNRIAAALAEERAKARAPFEQLFAGGPDTACRTTWRESDAFPECSAASTECVEVPMVDLRAAFEASE